jgi:WD40 repeat protein
LAFSPDGHTLASGDSDGVICLWDIRSPAQPQRRAVLHAHTDRVFAVAISPDGTYLASGSADHTVRLWDMHTHQLLQTLYGHTHWIWTIGISLDRATIASGGPDETIRLWNRQNGECIAVLVSPGPYAGMNIRAATGMTGAERTTLKLLGAVEE